MVAARQHINLYNPIKLLKQSYEYNHILLRKFSAPHSVMKEVGMLSSGHNDNQM